MDETKLQYLRYKNSFKKQCIFMIVANALALLTLIFLIFIPCFRISMKDDVTGMVFARYDFSLFDEIKLVLGKRISERVPRFSCRSIRFLRSS